MIKNTDDNIKYRKLSAVSILIWIVLFSAGLVVSSEPYVCQLKKGFSLGNFIVASFSYTPSNVAILSVLAGFIGGCMSKLIGADEIEKNIKKAREDKNDAALKNLLRRRCFLTEPPLHAMFRGFLTYLAIISGIVLLVSDPFEITSPKEYVRIAGLISGICFLMGYDPTRFEELIVKFSKWESNKA
jgi:hypothetical protein